MLDAREPQPMGFNHSCFRFHTDQPVIPDERHASAAYQTPSEFDKSRADRCSESRESSIDLGTTVRHPLYPNPLPSQTQDHRGNGLSDIFGHFSIDPSEWTFLDNVLSGRSG